MEGGIKDGRFEVDVRVQSQGEDKGVKHADKPTLKQLHAPPFPWVYPLIKR